MIIDTTVHIQPVFINGKPRDLEDVDHVFMFQPTVDRDLIMIFAPNEKEYRFRREDIEKALQICALAAK